MLKMLSNNDDTDALNRCNHLFLVSLWTFQQTVISDRIFCLVLLLLLLLQFIRFHLFCCWVGKSLPWIVDSLLNAMTVEECPHSAKSSSSSSNNDNGLHWKTNDASTTSVNRVTYLLFDEFVLHVVCMSIHFVIKGCESACRSCPIPIPWANTGLKASKQLQLLTRNASHISS